MPDTPDGLGDDHLSHVITSFSDSEVHSARQSRKPRKTAAPEVCVAPWTE